jgi:hypothetical protein
MKNPAIYFSEDGNRLCFITFNDTEVPEIQLKIYSEPDAFQLYTEHAIIRYPTVNYCIMIILCSIKFRCHFSKVFSCFLNQFQIAFIRMPINT